MGRWQATATIFLSLNIWAMGVISDASAQQAKYTYREVAGDPLHTRIYTLANGLKIYVSVNKNEPRVYSLIVVKSGSAHEPTDATGLAHYLEHILFKGSSKIGTLNWEEEKKLLDQLAQLFEEHRKTQDPQKKREIYKQIDSISHLAAKYAIPNEFDKLMSAIGARGVNAFTNEDVTAYMEEIPSNEIDRWLMLEKERFEAPVMRLFHTELETVYEEFNMRHQGMDIYRVWSAINDALFDKHPYKRDVIGLPEHLKNPSMVRITEFFAENYVPNNMVFCIAGDVDPDALVEKIDRYFGHLKPNPAINNRQIPLVEEEPLEGEVVREVWGPQPPMVVIAYRLPAPSKGILPYIELLNMILYNERAGIIDIDLIQGQKVLSAGAFVENKRDYTIHLLYAEPRQGQTLEEAKQILLSAIEKVKRGEFEDWLLEAAVNNYKLERMRQWESNRGRAFSFLEAEQLGIDWEEYLALPDKMASISKEELMVFASKYYSGGYAVIYKKQGENPNKVFIEKPPITPVPLNRNVMSDFAQKFLQMEPPPIQPVFVDFEREILKSAVGKKGNIPFYHVRNRVNELFSLYYIWDIGTAHDPALEVIAKIIPLLGTEEKSAEEVQKLLFRYGLTLDASVQRDQFWIEISGLNENFSEGVSLLEELLTKPAIPEEKFRNAINDLLKERENAQNDKGTVMWQALLAWMRWGDLNPFNYRLSDSALSALQSKEMLKKISALRSLPHRIFYYGPSLSEEIEAQLSALHKVPAQFKPYPEGVQFTVRKVEQPQVYYLNWDQVQAEMLIAGPSSPFSAELLPYAYLFNTYFGSGLSSVMFQEIREARALAYSAFAQFSSPRVSSEPFFIYAYVGTQFDKLPDALSAVNELLNKMPEAQEMFEASRQQVLRSIASERIFGREIFWTWERNRKLGIDYDIRRTIYNKVSTMTLDELRAFFNKHIAGHKFIYAVVGDTSRIPLEALSSIAPPQPIDKTKLFPKP